MELKSTSPAGPPKGGGHSWADGGADCDLIVASPRRDQNHWATRVLRIVLHQPLAYAALSLICPLNGGDTIAPVEEVAIYFARDRQKRRQRSKNRTTLIEGGQPLENERSDRNAGGNGPVLGV